MTPPDPVLRRLRRKLLDVGFRDASVLARLRLPAALSSLQGTLWWAADQEHIDVLGYLFDRYHAGDDHPLDHLIRLLLLERSVETSVLERVLGAADLRALEDAGIVEPAGREHRARLLLAPIGGDLLLAADFKRRAGGPGYVGLANFLSLVLARIIDPVRRSAAFDVGCAGGFQSLLQSFYVDRATGGDITPRAVEVARFNARLNDRPNADFVVSDGMEAATGPYDLITFYNDHGDKLFRPVMSALPSRLARGGWLVGLTTLQLGDGESVESHLAERLPDAGEYRLLILPWIEGARVHPRAAQAAVRTEDLLSAHAFSSIDRVRTEVEDWDARHVDREEKVFFVARRNRRAGERSWISVRRWSLFDGGFDGRALAREVKRLFTRADQLGEHPPGALLDRAPRLPADLHVVRAATWGSPDHIRLRRGGVALDVSEDVLELLAACDGKRTLGAALATFARRRRRPVAELRGDAEAVVRRLFGAGLLDLARRPSDRTG